VLRRSVADEGSRLQTLLDLKNAKGWLFADRVLLVEGKTEAKVLPDLISVVSGKSLTSRSIALVQIDGAGELADCMSVLAAMGMSCMAVADLDFVLDKALAAGLIHKDERLVAEMLDEFKLLADEHEMVTLGSNGRPCRDKEKKGGMKPSEVVTLWATTAGRNTAQALRRKLLPHQIWLWPEGDIEHHLGIPNKKGPAQAKFIEDIGQDGWQGVVNDVVAVKELVGWLDSVA